jgi:small subunit ribosomal protein S1
VVAIGDEVEVMVLDIDEDRRRISLGLKQCLANPWDEFASNFNKGERVVGTIKSITDFGIFVGLDGGIDGLVHLSDIAWNEPAEEAIRNYRKGQEIEAVVLAVDPERERISLGIKQLEQDPFSSFVAMHPKGSVVRGSIREVDAKGAVVDLGEGVEGIIRASDISRDRVEDARSLLKVGEQVEAKFTGVDRKNRTITLSIKAKEVAEEAEAVQEYSGKGSISTSLGDALRAQLDANKED